MVALQQVRTASTVLLATIIGIACSSSAKADFIDILSNHGVADPAPGTVINSTDGSGTNDAPDTTWREVHNLLDTTGLSGNPLTQASTWADTSKGYWNSVHTGHNRGDIGVLIDLGGLYTLEAMHFFGYNIQDSGTGYSQRTHGAFTVRTATDPAAVTAASGDLLVDEISLFAQQGPVLSLGDPGRTPTLGRTFLFGGVEQPDELGSEDSYDVTPSTVTARYVFLGGLTPIWLNPSDSNVVGLGEIRFYGTEYPTADFDRDGDVDGLDFLILQLNPSVGLLADWEANYGTVAPLSTSTTAVPEPNTVLLGVIVCLIGVSSRRHS